MADNLGFIDIIASSEIVGVALRKNELMSLSKIYLDIAWVFSLSESQIPGRTLGLYLGFGMQRWSLIV